MKDNRKGLVIAIIVLFVGASVVPSISGNDVRNTNVSNIEESKEEIHTLGDYLGLIAYWSFNDCTAEDDSGNGNHGVNFGADCVSGYDGSAFEFTNQDIVHYIPSSFDNTVTKYLRIESWVYWYGAIEKIDSIIFDAREFIPYKQGFVLTISQNGNVMFLLKSPGDDQMILSESTIPVNTWTHITAIFDYTSQTISILINNTEDNTISATTPYYNTGGVAAIGNNRWAPGDGEWAPFNGIIDELRIYDSYDSDLDCDGILDWTDVEPGSTVTDEFTVENIGFSGTELDWEIDSYPDWGTWTFTPSSGNDLMPEDGVRTIQVEVIAPDEEEKTFTGEIKIVNSEDSDDYCTIPVSLVTPVSQQSSLFLRFLERGGLTQRFPILEEILQLIYDKL